jgi:hypothetical protein
MPSGIFGNGIAATNAPSTAGAGAASFRTGWQSLLASMNAGTSLDGIKDEPSNHQALDSTAETTEGSSASVPAAPVLTATIPFLEATPVQGQADPSGSGNAPTVARSGQVAPSTELNLQQRAAFLAGQTGSLATANFSVPRAASAARADSSRESKATHSARESKHQAASNNLASSGSSTAAALIPSATAVIVQPVTQPVPANTSTSNAAPNSLVASESPASAIASSAFASMAGDYSLSSIVTRTSGPRHTQTEPNSSVAAVSGAASEDSAEDFKESRTSGWQGQSKNGSGGGLGNDSGDELGSTNERFLGLSSIAPSELSHEQSQTMDKGAAVTTDAAANQTLGAQQLSALQPKLQPNSTEAAGMTRSQADETAPHALLNKLPFTADAADASSSVKETASTPESLANGSKAPIAETGSSSQAGSNPGQVLQNPSVQNPAADAPSAAASSLLPASSSSTGPGASSGSLSAPAKSTPTAAGGGARKLSFGATHAGPPSSSWGATSSTDNRSTQIQDSNPSLDQNKSGSQSSNQPQPAAMKTERAAAGSASQSSSAGSAETAPTGSAKPLVHTTSTTANAAVPSNASDAAAAEDATSTRGERTAKQSASGTTHGTGASGVGASTDGSASLPAQTPVGTIPLQGSAQAQDPSATHGTTANSLHNTSGSSAGGDAESTTSKTFAALDAEPLVQTPTWIRAGAQQAEAGYKDPELGWVGVRADASGGVVHASLVPGSADASATLGSHLDGLNAYLTEHHTPVEAVTVAAPESRAAGPDMGQGTHQQMSQGNGQGAEESARQQAALNTGSSGGQDSGQGAPAEQYFTTQAVTPAAVAASSSGMDGNTSAAESVEAEGSNGVHISVVA